MEIKLIFKNGRQTYVNVKDLSQSEVEKAINAEEDRFGSSVSKIDQSEVQEHGAGGFIIGAVAGGYLTNLVMNKGVVGATKTVGRGVKKAADVTVKAVKKVSSRSTKSKKKSSTSKTGVTRKKTTTSSSTSKKPAVSKEGSVSSAVTKKNIRYISNSLIRSIDVKGGKRIFNKDIIDGAHLKKGISRPSNLQYSKIPNKLDPDQSVSGQTRYLSSRNIDSLQTSFGVTVKGSNIQDGAYIRKGVIFENGGIIDTSRFTKEDFFKVVNNWVYFTYNYPHNFVHKVFNNEHFEAKFSRAYERHGSASAVVSFWHELDTENQKMLAVWVKNNYFNYKSEEESLKAISDDVYAEIISIWNRFCYNYPHTFVNDALTSNPKHFESKFTRSYEKYGSRGAVNNFFSELSTDLQRVLTDWVYDYYSANKFAEGGSTDTSVAQTILQQIGGRSRVSVMTGAYNFLAGKNSLSFRIKNPKANYIKITLNGKDLYDVEIGKAHGLNYKVVKTYNDVYAEDLIGMLEEGTGMYFRFEDGGMVDSFGEGGSTGEKIFSIHPHSIGKAKYVIDYYDGHSTHKDGSKFIGIKTFSSKEKLSQAVKQMIADGYTEVSDVFNALHNNNRFEDGGTTSNPHRHTYMMLSRLQSDCEYFLNHGGRSEKNLWALSVDAQIEEMKNLWNSLPEDGKPEWLTMEQIEEYEKQMKEAPEYSEGGSIDGEIKVGGKIGFLNPSNGRYRYSDILSIEGDKVNMVERHPTRSSWDNYFTETLERIHKYLKTPSEDFADGRMCMKYRKPSSDKFSDGGSVDSDKSWKSLQSKATDFLSKNYPDYTQEKMDSMDDEEFNDKFFEMVDRIREEFPETATDNETASTIVDNYIFNHEFEQGGSVDNDQGWHDLKSKAKTWLSEKYPENTDENLSSLEDEEYNDVFFEMVDAVREQFPETADDQSANYIVEDYMSGEKFEQGGRISEYEGTKYFSYDFTNKGIHWNIVVVWGNHNYIGVLKKSNNPYGGRIGKDFKNLDEALSAYRDMNIKAQIIFAVEEAEKHGYDPEKFEDGGSTSSLKKGDHVIVMDGTEAGQEVRLNADPGTQNLLMVPTINPLTGANNSYPRNWLHEIRQNGNEIEVDFGWGSSLVLVRHFKAGEKTDDGDITPIDLWSVVTPNGNTLSDMVSFKEAKKIADKYRRETKDTFAEGGSISSVRELYDWEEGEDYPYARDMVAYFIFGDREDNKIADAIKGRFSKETADESALSEIMLQYEYSWQDNMPEIEEATMDELGDLLDYYSKGGNTRERRYVNHSQNHEKRYAKSRPHRTGLKGQRKFEVGGTTYAPLNSVEVIFEDPKHNYTTSVASSLTEEEARSYFVGKRFNVASFPREQFERVIDIKFTKGDGSQFANGGSIDDSFNWESLSYAQKISLVRESGLPDQVASKSIGTLNPSELSSLKNAVRLNRELKTGKFANGGSTQAKSNKRYFPKSVEGYVFAKPVEEEPNNLIPVEYTGIGIFDSILGMFVALDNDGRMVPYRPAGGYSTAEEIAEQMNSGEIAQHAIYTVPHLLYKPAQNITLRPLEIDPLYTQLTRFVLSHEQAHNFFNVESHGMFGTDSNGGRGQMIENKDLGIRLMMPSKLYEFVDGYNLFISTYGGDRTIRTYPANYLVASIKEDGSLDFDVMDKAISLDRTKIKDSFNKGYIPTTSYRLIDRLKNSGITELPDYLKPRA